MKAVRLMPLAAGFCVACGSEKTASVTSPCDDDLRGVIVSPSSVAMTVGDSAQLAATWPAPACDVPVLSVPFVVFWRSSNPAVVTVDSTSGKTRGVGGGTATVLAIVVGDSAFKGAAAIQVNPR